MSKRKMLRMPKGWDAGECHLCPIKKAISGRDVCFRKKKEFCPLGPKRKLKILFTEGYK